MSSLIMVDQKAGHLGEFYHINNSNFLQVSISSCFTKYIISFVKEKQIQYFFFTENVTIWVKQQTAQYFNNLLKMSLDQCKVYKL